MNSERPSLEMPWSKFHLGSSRVISVLSESWVRNETRFLLSSVGIWLGFLMLSGAFKWAAKLPLKAHQESFLLLELGGQTRALAIGLVVACFVRSANFTWKDLEAPAHTKWLGLGLALCLAFAFATHPYNYYVDQSHLLDRLLMIGMAFSVIRWPLMVIPTLFYAWIFQWQIGYPSPLVANTTDKLLPLDLICVFGAYVLISAFLRTKIPFRSYLFVTLIVFGAQYFIPGLVKLDLGAEPWSWITDNVIAWIGYIAVGQGFSPLGLPDEYSLELLKYAAFLQIPIAVLVLAGQFVGILTTVSKRMASFLAADYILLHSGIWALTGIFFWKWIVVDLLIVWFLAKLPDRDSRDVFLYHRGNSRREVSRKIPATIIAMATIFFAQTTLHPVVLAWFDSPVSYSYYVTAKGLSGKEYEIPKGFFAPYDVYFAQARFYYLEEGKVMVGTFGGTSHRTSVALQAAESVEDIKKLERIRGKVYYHEGKKESLNNFIKRFLENSNRQGDKLAVFSVLGRPNHIWSDAEIAPRYERQEQVTEFSIVRRTLFIQNYEIRLVDQKTLLTTSLETFHGKN